MCQPNLTKLCSVNEFEITLPGGSFSILRNVNNAVDDTKPRLASIAEYKVQIQMNRRLYFVISFFLLVVLAHAEQRNDDRGSDVVSKEAVQDQHVALCKSST